MTDDEAYRPRLEQLLADVLRMPVEDVSDDLSRDNAGGWTSLRHLELVAAVEAGYGVRLDPREIRSIRSVADVRKIIETHLSAR